MIYNILFAVCGIGLIALGLSLMKLYRFTNSWAVEVLRNTKLINDIDTHIQELEERLEAQAAELTEHHNKIDTLEINGSVYEGLFEQQGLWGESSEVPDFPDPEDEGIVI